MLIEEHVTRRLSAYVSEVDLSWSSGSPAFLTLGVGGNFVDLTRSELEDLIEALSQMHAEVG